MDYYSSSEVQRELSDFCKGRWVALHCLDASGKLVFQRYAEGGPLKIDDLKSIPNLLNFWRRNIRSIYATANIYRLMRRSEDVYDFSNVQRCTPTWDIDGVLSNWRETIAIVREIIGFLSKHGVDKSIYVKWSGNGCHVHIHEKAFSDALLEKHHPIDLAYAIVEYANTKLFSRFLEISPNVKTVVENKMDPARVFTCPLSLHRKLDVACICMKPIQLDDFTPEWTDPQRFRHNPSWREFREGEADELAERAYQAIGGYPLQPMKKRRKTKPLDKQIMTWLQKE